MKQYFYLVIVNHIGNCVFMGHETEKDLEALTAYLELYRKHRCPLHRLERWTLEPDAEGNVNTGKPAKREVLIDA